MEQDFGVLMSAQIVKCAFIEVVHVQNKKKRSHFFLTKISKCILNLLEFMNTRLWMIGVELFSHMSQK